MKIGLVLYEDESWILAKFAENMKRDLLDLGVEAEIITSPSGDYDINHHIEFCYVDNKAVAQADCIHTSMVTHTDDMHLFKIAKAQLDVIDLGICMSRDWIVKLGSYGVPTKKLTHISPPHDQITTMRPIIIGIASRVYVDGRKNEKILPKALKALPPELFHVKIMGAGWEKVAQDIKEQGVRID